MDMEVSRAIKGLYLHTQRLSTEDGPGIRTTLFMKGCPLRCWWCHNPESLSREPQTQWNETYCIGCETCVSVCPNGCLSRTLEGIVINRECCQACGTCAEACPSTAMELLGKQITPDAIFQDLLKDRSFFNTSGGGITISGGEPMLQPDFVAEVLSLAKNHDLHTAIDTCGFCSSKSFEKVLPYVDLVLFDLKEMDPEKHKEFTGQGNQRILENLILVRDTIESNKGKRLWIRTPLIPGATTTKENIDQIGRFIAANLNGIVDRWELCAFNNLCKDKYHRLNMEWRFSDTSLLSNEELIEWEQYARGSGVDPAIVIATGAIQIQPA
jgi:pyruvate formate lyase activating enzyme